MFKLLSKLISYNLKKKILVKQTGISFYWVVDEKRDKIYLRKTVRTGERNII